MLCILFNVNDTRQGQSYIKTEAENCGSQHIAGLLTEISERDRIEVVGLWERTINASICIQYIYCSELLGLTDHNPEKLTTEKEMANARIRIYMPKV